ncbi:MAG: hypothetical protein GY820_45615 [Gammaproteobacteria bacterium]|nr:hypothetical protein [Gammaproteobacteria bacterium]
MSPLMGALSGADFIVMGGLLDALMSFDFGQAGMFAANPATLQYLIAKLFCANAALTVATSAIFLHQ